MMAGADDWIAVRADVIREMDGDENPTALCVEVKIGGGMPAITARFLAVLPEDFEMGARGKERPVFEADPCGCSVSGWCERSGGVTLDCRIPAASWRRFSE